MSKIIPPLLSSSPPPMVGILDEDEEDDFGDFTAATDVSYGCDALSLPSSPVKTSTEETLTGVSDDGTNCTNLESITFEKDFQDKRKENSASNSDDLKSNSTQMCNGKVFKVDDTYNSSFRYFPEVPPEIVCDNNENASVSDEFDDFQDSIDAESFKQVNVNEDLEIQMENLEISGQVSPEISNSTNLQPEEAFNEVSKIEQAISKALSEIDYNVPKNLTEEVSVCNDGDDEVENVYNECDNVAENSFKFDNEFQSAESTELETSQKLPEVELSSLDDSFGDFEEPVEDITDFQCREKLDSLEGFGEFDSTRTFVQEIVDDDPFKCDENLETNFGDFESQVFEEQPTEASCTYTSLNPTEALERQLDIGDDEEFDDFTMHSQAFKGNDAGEFANMSDMQIAFEKAKEIVLKSFPRIQETSEEYHHSDYTGNDVIFLRLKDVTDTIALSYQWGKSTSQKCMLGALNIDSRNILYGPRWNESIPRYAATLGFQPLEPVKFESVTTPAPLEPSAVPSSSQSRLDDPPQSVDIPSAQFDWASAGLTNPLENSTASTMLLDLEQLVATLDIQYSSNLTSKSPNSSSPVNDNDEWDFWLSSVTPKLGTEKKFESNNYDAVYSTSNITKTSPTTNDFEFSPTIEDTSINAELQNDKESVKSLQFTETLPEYSVNKDASTMEFCTWQSSAFENETNKWSFNPHLLRETHITSSTQNDASIPQCLDDTDPNLLKPVVNFSNTTQLENTELDVDEFADFQTGTSVTTQEDLDDEFTDFQSTLPNASSVENPLSLQQVPNVILEPSPSVMLQPTISADAPTSINWPDPGLTDFDLQHFELSYKAGPVSTENEPIIKETVNTTRSLDEDDWSDFVSNQNLQDLSKTSPSTSNYNHICEIQLPTSHLPEGKPPKYSVPSLKQQDVFENKVLADFSPLVQQSVQQLKTYPSSGLQSPISSHNFPQSNVNFENVREPVPNHFSNNPIVNSPLTQTSERSSNMLEEADDEWSDFVFSQPPPSSKLINGLIPPPKLDFDWNKPPQFTSWSTSITPNIITNPGSFDSFQSYAAPVQADLFKSRSTKKTPNVVMHNRGPIQSISSVPDLDFISSKSKTWKK